MSEPINDFIDDNDIEYTLKCIKNKYLDVLTFRYGSDRYTLSGWWWLRLVDDEGHELPKDDWDFDTLKEFYDFRLFDGRTFEEAYRNGDITIEEWTAMPYEIDPI